MSQQSTREAASLEQLLADIDAEYHGQARIVSGEEITTGGFLGIGARKSYQVTFEVPDVIFARPERTRPARGVETLLAAAEQADGPGPAPRPVPTTSGSPTLEAVRAHIDHSFETVLETMSELLDKDELTDPTPAPPAEPAGMDVTDRMALARLGLPSHLLRAVSGNGPVSLSTVLAAVPRPPALQRSAGRLLVVVGDGRTMWPTVAAMAERLHLDHTDVLTAGQLTAAGYEHVAGSAALQRLTSRTTTTGACALLAVGVGPRREDWSPAADLVAGAHADQVWAVVDARTTVRDTRAWLTGVGGARGVDVLAATNVFDAAEPAGVLDLGVPVGWMDTLPASGVAWAALLADRLGEHAHWG